MKRRIQNTIKRICSVVCKVLGILGGVTFFICTMFELHWIQTVKNKNIQIHWPIDIEQIVIIGLVGVFICMLCVAKPK